MPDVVLGAPQYLTGGTVFDHGNGYATNRFTSSGTLTAPTGRWGGITACSGGGGGGKGGASGTGGGGAGGSTILGRQAYWNPGHTYAITIGAGGAGATVSTARGGDGGDTL
jgi:hypothetical protein